MDESLSLEREIFISYAWGEETEEREAYVNRLCQAFADQGVRIIRDKEVLDYKGRIRAFMKRLGRGKYVIVVISDKYLKSPNCMFELVQIAKNGNLYDRIFPVVLPDAKIYDAEDRADYVIYWEGKSYSLNEKLRQLSSQANVPSLRKSIDDYDEIRSTIDRLVDILYDINTLKPNLISKSDFETLRNAIDEQIQLDEQPMPAEPVPESPVIPDNPSANPDQEQYRQKVRDLIKNGEISDIGLDLLEHLREDLNLSSEIAIQIKNQELDLARKPVRNRQRYQQLVQKVIDNAYPLTLSDERALDIAQQTLGISDRDADRIKKTLFPPTKPQILLVLLRAIIQLFNQILERIRRTPNPIEIVGGLFLIILLIIGGFEALKFLKIQSIQQQISLGERNLSNEEKSITDNKSKKKEFSELKNQGIKFFKEGKYDLAKEKFEKAQQIYKNSPETLIYLNNAKIGNRLAYTIAVAAQIDKPYGLGILRGVAMAQNEINEDGGIADNTNTKYPFRVMIANDENKSNKDLATYISSTSVKVSDHNSSIKVLGLIGHQTSQTTWDLGDIYNKLEFPVVSPSSSSSELFGKFDYVHLISPSTFLLATVLREKIIEIIKNTVKNDRIIVFYDSEEKFSQSLGTKICTDANQTSASQTSFIDSQNRISCQRWNISSNKVPQDKVPQVEIGDKLNVNEIEDINRIKDIVTNKNSSSIVIAFNPDKDNRDNRNYKIATNIIKAINQSNSSYKRQIKLYNANTLYDESLRKQAEDINFFIVSAWANEKDINFTPSSLSKELSYRHQIFLDYNNTIWGTPDVNWYTLMAYNATKAFITAIGQLNSPTDDEGLLKSMRKSINSKFLNENIMVKGGVIDIIFSSGFVKERKLICLTEHKKDVDKLAVNCEVRNDLPIKPIK